MEAQAYRARRPKLSPLWQCLDAHFDTFLEIYPEAYEHDFGFLRPVIPEVVGKFMGCGDFANGFARVRCDHCAHEYLLPFSCKGRWFCPSCHQKKVQLFGALLAETVLAPVPHRHFTFTIPKMLRPYFRFHRGLIKELCRIAHRCLAEFQRTTLGLPEGTTGVVMAIIRREAGDRSRQEDDSQRTTRCIFATFLRPIASSLRPEKNALLRWRNSSAHGSSRFWSRGDSCRQNVPGCCVGGRIPGSTSTAASASRPATARTWNGSPNTSSATRSRSIKCSPTAPGTNRLEAGDWRL